MQEYTEKNMIIFVLTVISNSDVWIGLVFCPNCWLSHEIRSYYKLVCLAGKTFIILYFALIVFSLMLFVWWRGACASILPRIDLIVWRVLCESPRDYCIFSYWCFFSSVWRMRSIAVPRLILLLYIIVRKVNNKSKLNAHLGFEYMFLYDESINTVRT